MLQGSRVVLRPGRDLDLDALEEVFAAPEVARWWPMRGREQIAEEVLHREEPGLTVYVIEADDRVVGVIQSYEESDEDYRSAGLDISIHPTWHGTGVAVDALRTLAQHLFDHGHHRLTIDPAAHNQRAIAAYAKVGFRPVGVMRQYERGADGTWHDGLLMDLLRGELR